MRHSMLIYSGLLSIAALMWARAQASPAEVADPRCEPAFLAENAVAMNKMMATMAIAPTGDVDRDFAEMMIPHHQGAIDMAVAQLRYGRNEQLRRLAQEIVVTQRQEIAVMRKMLDQELPKPAKHPTPAHSMPMKMSTPSTVPVPAGCVR